MKKLRVIFQGGGAKLATLLSAAHALEKICTSEGSEYQIVEYGGVSAGSIAAAAMSLPKNDSTLYIREQLILQSKTFDRKVRWILSTRNPIDYRHSPDAKKYKLTHLCLDFISLRLIWLPITRIIRWLYYVTKLTFGGSLISEKTLIRTLTSVFSDEQGVPYRLSSARNLTVFSSILSEGRSKPYRSSSKVIVSDIEDDTKNESDTDLGYALAKSSSMPFVFSGHRVKNSEVDGGICGNVPAPYFISADSEEIKTLVFVFPQEQRKIAGLWSFFTALLSSAMDSTVREAIIQTTESGGAVCELPSFVETYNFPKALASELEENRFLRVSHDIEPLIEHSLMKLFGVGDYKVLRTTKYSRDEVSDIFDDLYKRYPVRKTDATKIMVDKSARRGDLSRFDERCYIDEFEPSNGKIEVCQIGLPFNLTGDLSASEIQGKPYQSFPLMRNLYIAVKDALGQSVNSLAYIALSQESGKPKNRILIFLKEEPTAFPIRVITRFDGEVFGDYRSRGWDFFSTHANLGMSCDKHRWLCVLNDESKLETCDLSQLPDDKLEEVLPFGNGIRKRLALWKAGQPCTNGFAERFIQEYCSESIHPDGQQRIVSWEVENLEPGHSAGFRFDRK